MTYLLTYYCAWNIQLEYVLENTFSAWNMIFPLWKHTPVERRLIGFLGCSSDLLCNVGYYMTSLLGKRQVKSMSFFRKGNPWLYLSMCMWWRLMKALIWFRNRKKKCMSYLLGSLTARRCWFCSLQFIVQDFFTLWSSLQRISSSPRRPKYCVNRTRGGNVGGDFYLQNLFLHMADF